MAKTYSVAAKRRAKKAMPVLAEVKRRQPNGQARQRADAPDDPRKVALTARCVQMGIKPTKENRANARTAMLTHPLGMVLSSQAKTKDQIQEATALWATFHGYCSAERAWRTRYLGNTGDPQGANIGMMPEPMQADTSHTVDLRSPEEKDSDTIAARSRWLAHLAKLTWQQAAIIAAAERDPTGTSICKPLWSGGPTAAGLFAADALKALHIVVKGG